MGNVCCPGAATQPTRPPKLHLDEGGKSKRKEAKFAVLDEEDDMDLQDDMFDDIEDEGGYWG